MLKRLRPKHARGYWADPLAGLGGERRLEAERMFNARRTGVVDGYSYREMLERRTLHIHIPKAAGTAINHLLFGHQGGGHTTLRQYRRVFRDLYGVRDVDSFFSFAFVRNPWDRCHSAYRFLKGGGMNDKDREFADRHLAGFDSFAAFVRGWLTPKHLYRKIHFVPQYEFVIDTRGRVAVSFIGRFERLRDDYARLADRLGTEAALPERNVTAGSRAPYTAAYDDDTRALVGQLYARDIAEFGYRFGE